MDDSLSTPLLRARPRVLASCAVSLDGCIDHTGRSRLVLSSSEDLERVDALRASCDAILIGAGTLRRDNPRLLIRSERRVRARREEGRSAHPARAVITGSGEVPSGAAFFTNAEGPRLIYCPQAVVGPLQRRLGEAAVVVAAGGQDVDPRAVLEDLAGRSVRRLLVEGGTTILTLFLSAGLVDELRLAIAPCFVGDAAAPRFVHPVAFPSGALRKMRLADVEKLGDMAILRYEAEPRLPELDRAERDIGPPRATEGARECEDLRHLRDAIELSKRCTPSAGAYSVGALIVEPGGLVIATGYSREREGAHAEEVAIERALREERTLAGSTLYTSLEPCSVRLSGRRSCVERIIEHRIARVVFALREPPVFVRCEGVRTLQEQGVVVVGIPELAAQVAEVNRHLLSE